MAVFCRSTLAALRQVQDPLTCVIDRVVAIENSFSNPFIRKVFASQLLTNLQVSLRHDESVLCGTHCWVSFTQKLQHNNKRMQVSAAHKTAVLNLAAKQQVSGGGKSGRGSVGLDPVIISLLAEIFAKGVV